MKVTIIAGARINGAIFMKLGRAPAIIVTFILL